MRSGSSAAAAKSFQIFTLGSVRGKRASFIHGVESWNPPPETQIRLLMRSQIDRNLPSSVLIRRNPNLPIASSSSSESQVELEIVNDDETLTVTQLPDQDDSQKVQIRLQLRKECQFGEQFLVAGDHPELGLWDPVDAAPMVWSDGHVWTAELDLPAGKLIQFKFVLREISGKLLWQPGPNRVIQTTETSKIIAVFGEWEKLAVRQMTEERKVEKVMFRESFNGHHIASLNGGAMDIGAESTGLDRQDSGDEREGIQVEGNGEISSNEVAVVVERFSSDDVIEEVAVSNKGLKRNEVVVEIERGIPVLVPGLSPCLIAEPEVVNAFDVAKNSIADSYESECLHYNRMNQILLGPKQEEGEGYQENKEEEEATVELMYDKGHAQIQLDPKQEEGEGHRENEEEKEGIIELKYDRGYAQIQLDPKQEEAEEYREEEEAVIAELIFDKEQSEMEYANKARLVAIDEPSQGLELTLCVGQDSRNNSVLHNYIRQGQETLRSFLNKLGFH